MAPDSFRWRSLVVFYALAFVLSWLGWLPQALHSRGLFPFDHPLLALLGGVGPTLAAVITVWALEGKDGPRALFAPLFRWRVPWLWYAVVLLSWFVVALVALGVGTLGGHPFPPLGRVPWGALPSIFVAMVLSNVWEEVGWRGFALPRFQERLSDLATALLMGVLWMLWHVPLLLNPASPMSGLPWYAELLFSLALSVIYIWLYNHTRRSLLLVTLFHAMSNTVAWALMELGVYTSSYPFVVGVTAAWAAAIVLRYGARRFASPASAETRAG